MAEETQGDISKPDQKPSARFKPFIISPKWFLVPILLAVIGALGFNYLIEQSLYGSGPFVRFPFRGRGQPSAIRFNLPEGWRVKYNGHHPLGQGSIVDQQGKPRIEICWFQGSSRPDPVAEFVTARTSSMGEVASYRLAKTTNSSPFSSFPLATRGVVDIIDLEFLFDKGELMFTVRADEEATLTDVVWRCMETVRYEAK
jgi:hypothetical protein